MPAPRSSPSGSSGWSRRPDRATKASFLKKVENFESEVLDMPFNLARQDFEMILKNDSGITDWKEDAQHLQNQLQRDQVGTCDRLDCSQRAFPPLHKKFDVDVNARGVSVYVSD